MLSRVIRRCSWGAGVFTLLVALPRHAAAGVFTPAPEIDGMSISAGLGVLAAGILILRARRSRR
jgi:hypothetical protein